MSMSAALKMEGANKIHVPGPIISTHGIDTTHRFLVSYLHLVTEPQVHQKPLHPSLESECPSTAVAGPVLLVCCSVASFPPPVPHPASVSQSSDKRPGMSPPIHTSCPPGVESPRLGGCGRGLRSALAGLFRLLLWLARGIDFEKVVDDDEDNRGGAKENRQAVEVVVADHVGELSAKLLTRRVAMEQVAVGRTGTAGNVSKCTCQENEAPNFLGCITFVGVATACCWVVAVQGIEDGEDVIWTAFHVQTNGSFTKHVTVRQLPDLQGPVTQVTCEAAWGALPGAS